MKTRLLLLVWLFTLWSGFTARAAEANDEMKATLVDPSTPAAAGIRATGEAAINRLAYTMMNELAVAQSKGDAESAVDVCHLKAVPATAGQAAGLPGVTGFKLTSLKVRNPANAPDAAEKQMLDYVEMQINDGADLPKVLVQRVQTGTQTEWRVYRPLGIAPRCVTCHGDPEDQPAALRAKLEKLYPSDQATGYSPGAWRGLIRVTVAAGGAGRT